MRFGAIGDLVMTSPIIRCIKEQLKTDVHFLTKSKYRSILEYNIYIDKLYCFEKDWVEHKQSLIVEDYNLVVDLHKTPRSFRLRSALKCPFVSFKKYNLEKWMFLNLRFDKLPSGHLVDHFFKAVTQLKVENDNQGLDIFIDDDSEKSMLHHLNALQIKGVYTALVIGGAHATKQIPIELCVDYINQSEEPIMLLGGPLDVEKSNRIAEYSNRFVNNMVGQCSLLESAVLVRESQLVITGDTGLMHVAAAFNKKMIVVYGSTSPQFGMYPFMTNAETEAIVLKNDHLSCWPCSKSGRSKCPKEHMKCLMDWTGKDLINLIKREAIRN